MDWELVLRGIGIGMAVAAPIGPINVMVIRSTLKVGFWEGISTGAGAVLGDGFFALVAAFGITAIAEFIVHYEQPITAVGGIVLLILGVRTILAHPDAHLLGLNPPATVSNGQDIGSHIALVGTTFVITVTNPATLMGFLFIFSSVGGLMVGPGDYVDAGILVLAVMLGSLLWWTTLAAIVNHLRDHLTNKALRAINWVSGGLVATFGIFVLIRAFWVVTH